ncbi:MAG: phosphoenolpyruvate--protein phosphotransferase [Treponema sp.]|nr:phosphoenolpyruvate--protein phosphotransferase [Treponema sp.]
MRSVSGKSVFNGIAIGKLYHFRNLNEIIKMEIVENTEEEFLRIENALIIAKQEMKGLYNKALELTSEEEASIFEIHEMLLEDDDFLDSIKININEERYNAEYSVYKTGIEFEEMFTSMDDEYMQARAADIKDISRCLIRILSGAKSQQELTEPVIIYADDLTPSETVRMNKNFLLGFITKGGSVNSHTAILARTIGIPALVGVKIEESWNGLTGAINGYDGILYIEPDIGTMDKLQILRKKAEDERKAQKKLILLPSITIDGKEIEIFANAGNEYDVKLAAQNGAEGIGLFRTEFLYLETGRLPTEEEQFTIYKSIAEIMGGKKVIIRTLDIGADKQVSYLGLDKEENPALGYRAIRICLTQEDIFRTQLRAILRASVYGKIAVMFPMIISLNELRDAKRILEECKVKLISSGFVLADIEIGIMIETPAAVMIADELAKEVDFFSIGTNDLTQYTLAIDRQNQKLEPFYDSHHPAIIRMIEMTIDSGHRNGCWVGICGELASDLSLTETFLSMGIDELSVSPNLVLPLRQKIRETNLEG